jgi:hypothetical protein
MTGVRESESLRDLAHSAPLRPRQHQLRRATIQAPLADINLYPALGTEQAVEGHPRQPDPLHKLCCIQLLGEVTVDVTADPRRQRCTPVGRRLCERSQKQAAHQTCESL